ncbi:hypothetical protein CF327_g5115 [Tilletia walkeri]|uniref:FAM50A/XAP5 C-terminal domain-containing protein n=1 Tax=Tilletia walkeri TaxID=117179 RepID=A0A8X7N8Z5_9BASI|nr:hypothetical protein CF327_g5115 [Tilletia walkeri]KAE8268727.1 hypothetical protein A4X09_0g3603 [Tilletia walkeri]
MADGRDMDRKRAKHERERADMQQAFDRQKAEISRESERNRAGADRFVGKVDSVEETLKKSTVGLVRLEDFQRRKEELEEEKRREAAKTSELKPEERKKKRPKKDSAKPKLSFAMDDEEEDQDADAESSRRKSKKQKIQDTSASDSANEPGPSSAILDSASLENAITVRRSLKNPNVDTSFLPDREREEDDRRQRETLRQEFLQKQKEMKNESIEITYSYWDGSGHRRVVKCKKGDSIAQFLEKCRQQFPELRGISVDNMMYIKEDLIVPHHYTFYDFIVNKSRGKSGPLFNFDVHDDVRMLADATVEKDESHAGKVVERSWYDRNKHIFPASRWEVYDPNIDYGNYSIKGT